MLKNIPEKVYDLLDRGADSSPSLEILNNLSERITKHAHKALSKNDKKREPGKLWFSDLGEKCDRKVWYKWNGAPNEEPLRGNTLFKFLYGDLLEELLLTLVSVSGSKVELEQKRIEYEHTNGWTISGRIDAVIDGVLVDVKSTSSYGFKKYKEGIDPVNDTFGYIPQLSGYYNLGFKEDIEVSSHNPGFLFVDKQNGNICFTEVDKSNLWTETKIKNDIERVASLTSIEDVSSIPRGYADVPEGKSGNKKLGIQCSYCPFKADCWPNLRTFVYSSGPVYLTEVKRVPKVTEI